MGRHSTPLKPSAAKRVMKAQRKTPAFGHRTMRDDGPRNRALKIASDCLTVQERIPSSMAAISSSDSSTPSSSKASSHWRSSPLSLSESFDGFLNFAQTAHGAEAGAEG